jgi:hypothetical protein
LSLITDLVKIKKIAEEKEVENDHFQLFLKVHVTINFFDFKYWQPRDFPERKREKRFVGLARRTGASPRCSPLPPISESEPPLHSSHPCHGVLSLPAD